MTNTEFESKQQVAAELKTLLAEYGDVILCRFQPTELGLGEFVFQVTNYDWRKHPPSKVIRQITNLTKEHDVMCQPFSSKYGMFIGRFCHTNSATASREYSKQMFTEV